MRQLWQHFNYRVEDLHFDECGIQQFHPGQGYQYTVYQPYVLHWIASGKGYLEIDQQRYHLEANQGFILKRGQQVAYYADDQDPWCNYWIGFSGRQLDHFLHHTSLEGHPCLSFLVQGQCQEIIQEICHRTLEEGAFPHAFYWYMTKLYALLYYAHEELSRQESATDSRQLSSAEVAAAYIYANYHQSITIEQVAQYIGVSRSALFRLFRQHYHCSPKQFLMETRLRQARQLLVEGQAPIKQIAASVGYADQLYFSKIFKQTYGISPSQYRIEALEPDYVGPSHLSTLIPEDGQRG